MHAAGRRHLHVTVDDRAAGAPEAVPDQEVVLRARILLVRRERPATGREEAIANDLRVHRRERVVLVEHQNTVIAVVLRHVRRRDAVFPAYAAEGVRRRPGLRVAERIVAGSLDRLAYLVRSLYFEGTARAKIVEQRALEHHQIRDADDLLFRHGVDGTELLGDPVMHLGGRIEPPDGRGRREDPLGGRARFGRKRGDPLLEFSDRGPRVRPHAARLALAAAAYISTYLFADAVHE